MRKESVRVRRQSLERWACVLVLLIGRLAMAAPTDFYLAPTGSDRNPGTVEKPFATLARARDAVRSARKTVQRGNIHVWLRGGTYRLAETTVFDLRDSVDNAGQGVFFAAMPGETPIISGAAALPSKWVLAEDNRRIPAAARGKVWTTTVPEGWPIFRTLYQDDRLLPRARSRSYQQLDKTPPGAELPISNQQFYLPAPAIVEIEDFSGAEMVVIPKNPWVVNILPMTRVNRSSGFGYSAVPATYELAPPASDLFPAGTLWIENVLEALDTPGEWVLDTTTRILYLWPLDGGAPESNVLAPRLTELVRVEGKVNYDGPADQPIRGLVFAGLTFTQTDRWPWEADKTGWGLQHDWEMFDRPTAMLRFRAAEDCRVERCRFVESGSAGVRLDLHSQRIQVRGCEMAHLGGTGILLAGYGLGSKDVNRENVITDCHIHHVGLQLWHSPGIFVWQSGHNRIEHNHVHHTPYTGIVIGGRTQMARDGRGECARTIRWEEVKAALQNGTAPWTDREPLMHGRMNLVAHNDLHDCMEILADGNAIYVSGTGGGNRIEHNFIHDISSPRINAQIRCDDDQHDVTVERNVITRCCGEGFIFKGRNVFRNNIIFGLRDRIQGGAGARHRRGFIVLPYTPVDGSIFERNICVSTIAGEPLLFERASRPRQPAGQPSALFRTCEADFNLYYNFSEPGWGKRHLQAQQAFSRESHSLEADPEFRAPEQNDFRLKPDSPAFKLGFEEIDISSVGPRPD